MQIAQVAWQDTIRCGKAAVPDYLQDATCALTRLPAGVQWERVTSNVGYTNISGEHAVHIPSMGDATRSERAPQVLAQAGLGHSCFANFQER
eukprot:1159958-Pelagomonas_calceolata.AAC.3